MCKPETRGFRCPLPRQVDPRGCFASRMRRLHQWPSDRSRPPVPERSLGPESAGSRACGAGGRASCRPTRGNRAPGPSTPQCRPARRPRPRGIFRPRPRSLGRGEPDHRVRDTVSDGDACRTRTGNGPANRASLNMIALAAVLADRRGDEGITEAMRRLQLNRGDAIRAVRHPRHRYPPNSPPPPLSIENTSRRCRRATRCDGLGHPG